MTASAEPMSNGDQNLDAATVDGFGREWQRFDQMGAPESELGRVFDLYFELFPWEQLPPAAVGFDAGCGSGRWARFVAPIVGMLHCVDASSEALEIAQRALAGQPNCVFHNVSVAAMPFEPGTMDFGYALGVLHHLPDPAAGLRACVRVLRPGAPLLIYVYYALDARPWWYRSLWRVSDLARRGIARLPHQVQYLLSDLVAGLVYWPLARASLLLDRAGRRLDNVPLAAYRHAAFYTMRTDAFDRLATRLERRFTADQVRTMMLDAGLRDVSLSQDFPYWSAIGFRAE